MNVAEAPTNKSELRSFLGMTNFSSLFIKDYSSLTAPLRKLLLNENKWIWDTSHQNAFELLKNRLANNCMLNYFDSDLQTELICDGSPTGLGAILAQVDKNSKEKKIIAYASRSLTNAEQNYGQIEREALSILFGCNKFRIYLLGKHFNVITDHQPLVSMFNNPRSQAPFRVERMRLKLQGFCFTVHHMPGSKNPSDYMSRHSLYAKKSDLKLSKELEAHVNFIIETGNDSVTLSDVKKALIKDEVSIKLSQAITSGNLDFKRSPVLLPFKSIFKELSIIDGLIIKGSRIFIPSVLRNKILDAAHEGHQGIVKTKQLLRSKVWYPGLDKDVELLVHNCLPCQASILGNTREPLKMTELPSGPWESVATDFHGPLSSGHYLLVVIDEYSRFPEVEITKSTSANASIPKFDKIFASYGIPLKVKSDNGSPFNSTQFENYAKFMGFNHRRITPEYPQANGLVENFNNMIEKILSTAKVENKNWKQELYRFLRNYRATPHSTTGKSPAELMFQKRTFRTRLPEINKFIDDPIVREEDRKKKCITKHYADNKRTVKPCEFCEGDFVIVKKRRRLKGTPYYDPVPYTIVKRKGNMITAKRNDHQITRNSSFFKRVNVRHNEYEKDIDTDNETLNGTDENGNMVDGDENGNIVDGEENGDIVRENRNIDNESQSELVGSRRSVRIKNPPKKYEDYDMR